MKHYRLIANFVDGSFYTKFIRDKRDLSVFNKKLKSSELEILSIIRIGG